MGRNFHLSSLMYPPDTVIRTLARPRLISTKFSLFTGEKAGQSQVTECDFSKVIMIRSS